MGEPKSRRNRHNAASHHDSDDVSQDGSRYGDAHEARNAASAAEERVRVLEQYIKDMSIQNMQRMQASTGAEKVDKEVKKKDEEIAKLKAVVVAQGNELSESKRELESLKRDHTALRDQFEIGCRRLAHHAARYVQENSKWDLTASTTSTVSTVSCTHSSTSSLGSDETADFPKEPAPSPEKGGEFDGVPLRAEDTADYCSFPSAENLREGELEFIRRLRSDLRRIALPESVKKGARDAFLMGLRNASSDSLVGDERSGEQCESLKHVQERIGRVQGEMRGLYSKLGSLPDLHLIDPVQIIQTTSTSLTRMLHDMDQITQPIHDALQQSQKVLADNGPVTRRLRLAESDLKIKEQRHALKVELLEKRLGRLTSTLTSVQQETWRSTRRDDKSLEDTLSAALLEKDGAALANPPEEYKQFLELLSERERELRRAERQVMSNSERADALEQQIVDLAMAKFDAECAKAKVEDEFRQKEHDSRMNSTKTTPTASPTLPGTQPYGLSFEGLFEGAPAFCATPDHVQQLAGLQGLGLPPPPAFMLGSAMNVGTPPPPFYQTIFPYLGQGLAPPPEHTAQ
jgi:septal ring factor EnvC (AmiA/AmiB activator)